MVIHGWNIYFHPCFETQLNHLLEDARETVRRRPDDFRKSNAFKRLAAVSLLAFDQIPRNPAAPMYRQGSTLGQHRKHWFRATFFQQYRLFFRYSEADRAIVYAWVNDGDTLRAYGSKSDAYAVFARMLASGHPPDSWDKLMAAVIDDEQARAAADRVRGIQAEP